MKKIIRAAANKLGYEISRKSSSPPAPYFPLDQANITKLLYFKEIYDQISEVEGSIVECGVAYGNGLLMLGCLSMLEGKDRHLWGFDSFEGFPEISPHDAANESLSKYRGIFDRCYGNLVAVLGKNFVARKVTLIKGFFEDTLGEYSGEPIALLHLDADLYESTMVSLEKMYPLVQPRGVVMFDDYLGGRTQAKWPGAKKAVDEYFAGRGVQIRRHEASGKYYMVKQ